MLITHNLGIVAELCDNVAVVYGGEIVEYGSRREIFKDPSTPTPSACSARCPIWTAGRNP